MKDMFHPCLDVFHARFQTSEQCNHTNARPHIHSNQTIIPQKLMYDSASSVQKSSYQPDSPQLQKCWTMMIYLATQQWKLVNGWVNQPSQGAVRHRQQLGSHVCEAVYLWCLPLNQPELWRAWCWMNTFHHLLGLLRSWRRGRWRRCGGWGGLGRQWEHNGCCLRVRLRRWNRLWLRPFGVQLVQPQNLILSHVKIRPCAIREGHMKGWITWKSCLWSIELKAKHILCDCCRAASDVGQWGLWKFIS